MNFRYYILIIKTVVMWASLTGSKGQLQYIQILH